MLNVGNGSQGTTLGGEYLDSRQTTNRDNRDVPESPRRSIVFGRRGKPTKHDDPEHGVVVDPKVTESL